MILDATAGNRMMWRHLNYNCENVVFIDKERGLLRPADIVCDWKHLPFRDNVFEATIFDPPHVYGFFDNSIHSDPKASIGSWWGNPRTKRELTRDIIKGQIEFSRVSKRLCFKWNDNRLELYRVLTCFTEWVEVFRTRVEKTGKLGNSRTWWITFIRAHNSSNV